MNMMDSFGMEELCKRVIGCAFKVHSTLGPGFLESVYKKALLYELCRSGLDAVPEVSLAVLYETEIVGSFYADIVVEGCLICELKAVSKLERIHELQLVNYLKATGIDDGLLINFGSIRADIKHKYRSIKNSTS